jgi:hypothetical protein
MFSISLIFLNTLRPEVYSASKYQKQKEKLFGGSKARPVREVDNLTAV